MSQVLSVCRVLHVISAAWTGPRPGTITGGINDDRCNLYVLPDGDNDACLPAPFTDVEVFDKPEDAKKAIDTAKADIAAFWPPRDPAPAADSGKGAKPKT